VNGGLIRKIWPGEAIKYRHHLLRLDPKLARARKFDADLTFDFGSVVGEVEAPFPTPMSIWREAMADCHGFATAVLDAQIRLLRRGQAASG
jgi:hypothetical protein